MTPYKRQRSTSTEQEILNKTYKVIKQTRKNFVMDDGKVFTYNPSFFKVFLRFPRTTGEDFAEVCNKQSLTVSFANFIVSAQINFHKVVLNSWKSKLYLEIDKCNQ